MKIKSKSGYGFPYPPICGCNKAFEIERVLENLKIFPYFWLVSQVEEPCFSELPRDCGSPGSGSMGGEVLLYKIHSWVGGVGGKKEQCVLPLAVRESLSAIMFTQK